LAVELDLAERFEGLVDQAIVLVFHLHEEGVGVGDGFAVAAGRVEGVAHSGDGSAGEEIGLADLVDVHDLFGGLGCLVLHELVAESIVAIEIFEEQEEVFGVEAVLDGVLRTDGFAFFGFRAGGFLGIAAICFDLLARGHFLKSSLREQE